MRFRFDFEGTRWSCNRRPMLPVAILAGGLATRLRPVTENDPEGAGRDQWRAVPRPPAAPAARQRHRPRGALRRLSRRDDSRLCRRRQPLRPASRLLASTARRCAARPGRSSRRCRCSATRSSCSTAIRICPATTRPSQRAFEASGKPALMTVYPQRRPVGHEQRRVRRTAGSCL